MNIRADSETIERELEASQTCTSWSGRRKSGQFTLIMPEGWLLAPFIADMVNKTRQAYDGLPGSVEAILTLFFLSVTGLRPVDLENPVRV